MNRLRPKKHIANLDLIRAIAILMVLFYHIVQWIPNQPKWLISLTDPGEYGVQLFFVLSGFLVGGLYFHEKSKFGRVDCRKFITRRITRTMPPYFIVLAVSYLGAYVFGREPFDLTYLVFFQNYLTEIPFFMVSWSLCVEEHFYALLPFFLAGVFFIHRKFGWLAMCSAVSLALVLPLALRLLGYVENSPFGYGYTASHFHFDAMGFGVLLSWVYAKKSDFFRRDSPVFWLSVAASVGFLYLSNVIGHEHTFIYLLLAMAVSFSVAIFCSARITQFRISFLPATKLVANASYAIYLTHTLVIHLVTMAFKKAMPGKDLPVLVWVVVLFIATLVAGILFYLIIERPLMGLRDKYFPSRGKQERQAPVPDERSSKLDVGRV